MTEIYNISFNPFNITGTSQKGSTVFEAAQNLGISLRSDCGKKGTGKKFKLPGSDIYITLKDVRQVQLAKAALFVGIESLLNKAGITTGVDRTILTGAFGAKFNWQNARDIGMLPHSILKGKVESAQNLAGTGAVIALLDKNKRTEIETIARKINFLDLSCEPDFTLNFSNATKLPAIK